MSENQCLIVGGVLLPEPALNGYHAYEEQLKEQLTMISGRMVEELRGVVWQIDYASERIQDRTMRSALAVLRARGTKIVTFLPDNGEEMLTGSFLVTSITQPTLAFFDGAEPVWTGLSFTLREERPHT